MEESEKECSRQRKVEDLCKGPMGPYGPKGKGRKAKSKEWRLWKNLWDLFIQKHWNFTGIWEICANSSAHVTACNATVISLEVSELVGHLIPNVRQSRYFFLETSDNFTIFRNFAYVELHVTSLSWAMLSSNIPLEQWVHERSLSYCKIITS